MRANLKSLGEDKVNWRKTQAAAEKERNARRKCDAATRVFGEEAKRVGLGKILSPKLKGGLDRYGSSGFRARG